MLLQRGIILPSDVVNDSLHVVDRSSRNVMYLVRTGESGCVVKMPVPGEPGTDVTFDNEVRFYEWMKSEPGRALRDVVPRSVLLSREPPLVVCEYVGTGMSLLEQAFPAAGDVRFSGHARHLGVLLARIHAVDVDTLLDAFWADPPWIFSVGRPRPAMLHSAFPTGFEVIHFVQSSQPLSMLLDRLRRTWRPECLVHGDFKWGNVLPTDDGMVVVDWELARLGPPAWDLACVLQDYASVWFNHLVYDGSVSFAEAISQNTIELADIQKECRTFWSAYLDARSIDGAQANDLLSETLRHLAARLVQAAVEHAGGDGELPNQALYRLQFAANLARDPDRYGFQFFRIPQRLDLVTVAEGG